MRRGPARLRCVGLFALTFAALAGTAVAVEPCPSERNCAEVTVEGPSGPVAVGDTALVRVAFRQGPADTAAGGIDEIAAVTMTLGIPGLALADCSAPSPGGLPPSFVLLSSERDRYRVVVQNVTCNGRGSCLCPGTGELRDPYINLLLVGTQAGAGPRPLPSGELLGITLRVRPAAERSVPLHIYSALDQPEEFPLPPIAAHLSVGDRLAVDRSADDAGDTLNVRIVDGELETVEVTPTAIATATATLTQSPTAAATTTATAAVAQCTGDCNASGEITVNELIAGVGIALGSLPLSTCAAFDCTGTGQVEVSCLIAGVNSALYGCPE